MSPEILPSLTCPFCGRVSYNRNDVTQRYCGACHRFLDDVDWTLQITHVKHEAFRYDVPNVGFVRWDVTLAQECVAAGQIRTTVPIEPAEMQNIAQRNSWEPAKLPFVDPSLPGIAAPLVWDGAIHYVLIDGNHRLARALQDGLPFSAHLLTDEAARRCVIEGSAALLPWSYQP